MLPVELFNYQLPEELIAQQPPATRGESRMLVLDRDGGTTEIRPFSDIVQYISPGDAVIFNDTKVIRGRMYARKNGLPDGASFELLLLSALDAGRKRWKVFLKPGKRAVPGTRAVLLDRESKLNPAGDGFQVGERHGEVFEIEFTAKTDFDALQQTYGHMPLPPYIRRQDVPTDAERYQTVYARQPGAAAAPTAGLHFTPELLAQLEAKGAVCRNVTLHVGAGTFKPVTAAYAEEHVMHAEEYILSEETAAAVNTARRNDRKVLAVGTTSVRVLESRADENGVVAPGSGFTDIFLYPPYRPRCVDMLLTNFHLPKSTLLMLVAAFASRERILAAYELAVREKLRFFSYGDCMLIK